MPSNDPYFGNVVALLHMEDTGITDLKGKTVTKYGNAARSNGQYKFGSYACAFDGNGDYLQFAAAADWLFGTGAFTIEAWVYITANSATDGNGLRNAQIYTNMSASYGGFGFQIMGNGSTTGTGLGWEDKYGGASISGSISATVSQGVWHHICCCRESGGSTLYLGLDGTVYTTSIAGGGSRSLGSNAYAVQIGGQPAVVNWYRYLNGYIDDLRITKGVARYTGNYAVPTAPFPDYDRYLAGTITETSPHTHFLVNACRADTGAFLNEVETTTGSFEIPIMLANVGFTGPVILTCRPKTGPLWSANAAKSLGDFVLPTNPITTPYVYQCTGAGTTHAATEPTWSTTPGSTVSDNTVTWTCIGRLIQPMVQGPLIATL